MGKIKIYIELTYLSIIYSDYSYTLYIKAYIVLLIHYIMINYEKYLFYINFYLTHAPMSLYKQLEILKHLRICLFIDFQNSYFPC